MYWEEAIEISNTLYRCPAACWVLCLSLGSVLSFGKILNKSFISRVIAL